MSICQNPTTASPNSTQGLSSVIGLTFEDVDEVEDLARLEQRMGDDPEVAARCPFTAAFFESLRRTRHWAADSVPPKAVRVRIAASPS